jgi:PRTRC genetic system protein F
MRTGLEPICGGVAGGGGSRRAASPQSIPARTAASRRLTFPAVPSFSPDVPSTIERTQNRQTIAVLAQFLLDAGMIAGRRFCGAAGSIQDVCQFAFDNWLAAAIGEVKCFTPVFELWLSDESGSVRRPISHVNGSGELPPPRAVEISWKEASVCHWGVGAGLDYLEACVPMLGATVLDVIERKAGHAYPLFTPGMALDEASYLYWRGEEDETLALGEDCGDDQAARDAMARDMITRADIAAAFPAWALDYNRPRLPAQELSHIAANHACPFVRKAATLASSLDGTRTTAQYCVEEDGPFIGFGAVLCWREGDLAVQISDDYANLAWQSEYCDEIGKAAFALNDAAAMRRWMRNIKPNLTAIGLLDALLLHLVERE